MIPVAEPYLDGNEKKYVLDCLDTNWISSSGKYITEFEDKFAKYCGCKFGVATTSGTTALHLAVASLGIGRGDEVIVPDFTNIASANAVAYTGATPVFVDIEPRTFNINPEKIEEAITKKTKAIMVVHMFGHPCDMDPINEIAKRHKLFVIEDAAEAHGAEYKHRKTGSLGDVACFSFYANKIITTGEGGMIVTNNEQVSERAKHLRNLAFDKERRYIHSDIGFNYRLTNLQAALGLAQLENIEKHISMKRKIAEKYSKSLREVKGLTLPIEEKWAKNVFWMYTILVEQTFSMNRDDLKNFLTKKNIETRYVFYPMHSQPCFKNLSQKGLFPVSDEISRKGLYLPSGTGLRDEQIEKVVNSIIEGSKS